MRQPSTTALQLVVDAVPNEALRKLVLELLQNGAMSAAPLAGAPIAPDVAETATPAPPAKHAGGRPPGSRNKVMTGARAATRLASLPNRESIVRAVASGEMTQSAAARQLGCTAKTVATWVAKFRSAQPEPPAAAVVSTDEHQRPEQTATPAPAKRPGPAAETEAERAARLAKHAAAQRARDAEKRRAKHAAASAARAAQPTLPTSNGGGGAAHTAVSAAQPAGAREPAPQAAKPAPAKPSGSITADPALAPAFWAKAAERSPTAPWKALCEEFGIPIVTAMELCKAKAMPPIAPAAAARFLEMPAH